MWNNNGNNGNLKYPKIQALQNLAHMSAQMHMPNGQEFHQPQPMNHIQPVAPIHIGPVAPVGHAMAEQNASANPEKFLSVMKNMSIKKNSGVAY